MAPGETVPYLGKSCAPLPAFASKSWLGLAPAESQWPSNAPSETSPCPGWGGWGGGHTSHTLRVCLPLLGKRWCGGASASQPRVRQRSQPCCWAKNGIFYVLLGLSCSGWRLSTLRESSALPASPPRTHGDRDIKRLGRLVTKVAAVRAEGKPWGPFKVRGAMVKYYLKKKIIKKSKFKNPTEIKSGSHFEEWILSQHV